MLRQLSRPPELDVFRYVRQHRGAKWRVDHEVVLAALDIGRADILKVLHECDFTAFHELYHEDANQCSNASFGIGFAHLTPEWTFGGVRYTKREAPRWNRRVRDEATPQGVAACMEFLEGVGVKVQSSRFLRRLLHRVRRACSVVFVSFWRRGSSLGEHLRLLHAVNTSTLAVPLPSCPPLGRTFLSVRGRRVCQL